MSMCMSSVLNVMLCVCSSSPSLCVICVSLQRVPAVLLPTPSRACACSPPPGACPGLDISPQRPPTGGQPVLDACDAPSLFSAPTASFQDDTAITSRQCRRAARSPAASRVVTKVSCASRPKKGGQLREVRRRRSKFVVDGTRRAESGILNRPGEVGPPHRIPAEDLITEKAYKTGSIAATRAERQDGRRHQAQLHQARR